MGGLLPGLKLRRQRVKGTSPLVYSDSYHSLSFVCQCCDPVTAVPLTFRLVAIGITQGGKLT